MLRSSTGECDASSRAFAGQGGSQLVALAVRLYDDDRTPHWGGGELHRREATRALSTLAPYRERAFADIPSARGRHGRPRARRQRMPWLRGRWVGKTSPGAPAARARVDVATTPSMPALRPIAHFPALAPRQSGRAPALTRSTMWCRRTSSRRFFATRGLRQRQSTSTGRSARSAR